MWVQYAGGLGQCPGGVADDAEHVVDPGHLGPGWRVGQVLTGAYADHENALTRPDVGEVNSRVRGRAIGGTLAAKS
jgi:hypothetical protein